MPLVTVQNTNVQARIDKMRQRLACSSRHSHQIFTDMKERLDSGDYAGKQLLLADS